MKTAKRLSAQLFWALLPLRKVFPLAKLRRDNKMNILVDLSFKIFSCTAAFVSFLSANLSC